MRRAPLALAALAALALAAQPASADLKGFKKAWGQSSSLTGDARRDARLRALEGVTASDDDPKLAKLLCGLILEPLDFKVHDGVQAALERLSGPAVRAWTEQALGVGQRRPKEKRASRRVVLCHVLGKRAAKDEAARKALIHALGDADDLVATAAVRGLRELQDKAVIGGLVALAQRAKGRLAADVQGALRALTGESFATPAEWQSYWEAKGGGYSGPTKADESEEPPARGGFVGGTRTRLEPPRDGTTIYGTVTSSRVLFVVDVSGSMRVRAKDLEGLGRTRLEYVRESLLGVIDKQLDANDQFTVLSFSTDAKLMSKKLLKGSPANKKKASAWVKRLKPEEGTNVYLALERALAVPGIDTIYFLSDGSPSEGKSIVTTEIIGQVRAWNTGRGVRIHTIGFLAGDGKSLGIVQNKGMAKRFLAALAENNDGSARFFE